MTIIKMIFITLKSNSCMLLLIKDVHSLNVSREMTVVSLNFYAS